MLTLRDLQDVMKSRGFNQKQLAKACGCSEPTISTNLRGGKRRPDAQIVGSMSRNLGLPFEAVYQALTRREGGRQ